VGCLTAVIIFATKQNISVADRYSLLAFAVGVSLLAFDRILHFEGGTVAGLLVVALSGVRLNATEVPQAATIDSVPPVENAAPVPVVVPTRLAAQVRVRTESPRVQQKRPVRTQEMLNAIYE
jgi:hypothetical protein